MKRRMNRTPRSWSVALVVFTALWVEGCGSGGYPGGACACPAVIVAGTIVSPTTNVSAPAEIAVGSSKSFTLSATGSATGIASSAESSNATCANATLLPENSLSWGLSVAVPVTVGLDCRAQIVLTFDWTTGNGTLATSSVVYVTVQ